MRYKIEASGCCERNGMRQVRLCFYLDPGDARYGEHHVNMPAISEDGYPGNKKNGRPESDSDYVAWLDALPKKWQTNPFHNHFIYVPLDTTDKDITQQADKLLLRFYDKWQRRECLGDN